MIHDAKKRALVAALKVSQPVFWGYLIIGMTFGCLLFLQAGQGVLVALGMSVFVYAGAMQFMALPLIAQGTPLPQIALLTFLVNARHMVYGLSLFERFAKLGRGKPYAIFALTDEAYALQVAGQCPADADQPTYTLWLQILCHGYWVLGSVLGNALASLFPVMSTRGIEFTLTALFLVILCEQWRQFETKLPFLCGAGSGLAALLLFGKNNMLLFAVILLVLLLILLRKRLEAALRAQDARTEGRT